MTMNKGLEVFSDSSERLNYNFPDFPLYVRKGTLHQFSRFAAECHWHPDLEFISVLEGFMEYFVDGQIVRINSGNGIFVNSKRLHYGFSADQTDCSYIVVAVHPSLLGENSYPGKVFLKEKFGRLTEDYLILDSEIPWQAEIFRSMSEMFNEVNQNSPNVLRLLSEAASMCASVGDHIQKNPSQHPDDQSWMIFWKMVDFIHHNYDNKISLKNISEVGSVSRSQCCRLFNKYVGQSPNVYLNAYRILKSCEMLQETNRSICEIALACGFQTASYFSYVFRITKGENPQEYRRRIKNESKHETELSGMDR
jgi:AraC-like DNA-binding protein